MLLFITINYTLSSAILQVYFTIFFSSSMQINKIYAMCKFLGFRSYWSDQGASPLEPDRQGAGAEYFRAGKGVSPFPPGGGGSGRNRHGCTGAAHRSGRRKACFFAGFRHSLRLLPPEVTRGTSRC